MTRKNSFIYYGLNFSGFKSIISWQSSTIVFFLFAIYVQDYKKKSSSIADTIDLFLVVFASLFILFLVFPPTRDWYCNLYILKSLVMLSWGDDAESRCLLCNNNLWIFAMHQILHITIYIAVVARGLNPIIQGTVQIWNKKDNPFREKFMIQVHLSWKSMVKFYWIRLCLQGNVFYLLLRYLYQVGHCTAYNIFLVQIWFIFYWHLSVWVMVWNPVSWTLHTQSHA